MMTLFRFLFLGLLPLAVFAQTPVPAPDLSANPAAATGGLNPDLPTLFIAGDSTAAKGAGDEQQGWGVPFADYFDPAKINLANRARGGRSSRTFITEGLWDNLLGELKKGDVVLIQFGHNDGGAINEEPPGSKAPLRARGSLPGLGDEARIIDNVLTKKQEMVHTFGWYVRKMVTDVRARGATPVVLSPTVRNLWADGKIERGNGRYRQWDRDLAANLKVPFVDVTRVIADRFQELGEAEVKTLYPKDHTHFNARGADLTASLVVSGLRGVKGGEAKPKPFDGYLSEKGRAVAPDTLGWLNLPEPANPKLPSLLLIGDSTVRNGSNDGTGGEWGWGEPLGAKFNSTQVNIVNRAIGGLSSRTFLTQGHWARAKTLLKPGDFVVMQFGHNDNAPLNDDSRARGTIKGTGDESEAIENLLTQKPEVVHTYGWYLRLYIREAKALGVTPIVCSPVPRKKWVEGKIARTADTYAGWARTVAKEEGVAFIDLDTLVAERYEALGEEKVNALFADAHTHTSREGAKLNAEIVADALEAIPGTPFKAWSR